MSEKQIAVAGGRSELSIGNAKFPTRNSIQIIYFNYILTCAILLLTQCSKPISKLSFHVDVEVETSK